MLEYEKKILLTKEEFEALYNNLCESLRSSLNVNYYFDTKNLNMNKKGITCRVRKKGKQYFSVIKHHRRTTKDCSSESILNVQDHFDANAFENLGLDFKGCLITERYTIFKNPFCEVVIDRNIYLGKTDFELEVEYFKGCENEAYDILHKIASLLIQLNVNQTKYDLLKRIGKNGYKSERFFNRYKEVSKNELYN